MCVLLEEIPSGNLEYLGKSDFFEDELEWDMLEEPGLLLEIQAGQGMCVQPLLWQTQRERGIARLEIETWQRLVDARPPEYYGQTQQYGQAQQTGAVFSVEKTELDLATMRANERGQA